MRKSSQKIFAGTMAAVMSLSLCGCQNQEIPQEDTTKPPVIETQEPVTENKNQVTDPVETTPPVEETTPPVEETPPAEEEMKELEFNMTDNPPEAMEKVDAAKWLLDIMDESLTKSLSQQSYSVVFSEVLDSHALYGNSKFNYRGIDLTRDGEKIFFEAMNGGKFYKGEATQTPGEPVTNLAAKNLITSRNIDALKELNFENGINDIYSLFMNVVNLDSEEFNTKLKEHPEVIDINFENLEDGNTKYTLSIINPGNFLKTTNNKSASSYVEKNSKTYLENSKTEITLIVDNNKLVQSINLKDTMSAGFYNQTYLGRYIKFTYNSNNYNPETASGNGELPVVIGSMSKELNIGRVVKYTNPNSAETSGGVDNTRWEITYKKQSDGSQKAVQLTASPDSGYTVNGIKKGMPVVDIKTHFNSTIYQDNDLVIGLVKVDQNVYTVIVYLNDEGGANSISVKLNPTSSLVSRLTSVSPVGSYVKNVVLDENIVHFNNNKITLINMMFKTLTKSFSMKQTVEISGQNLGKYTNKVMGTEIHPELNYIYSSITGDKAISESNTIKRMGSFSSPATVLNVFIQNVPQISLSSLNKAEMEDGTTSYSGNLDVNDVGFEQLIKLACGYPNNDITDIINDVNAVAEPLNMFVDILEKDGLILTMQIKLESKRDTVLYNLVMDYQ